jgi:hypothetical protein
VIRSFALPALLGLALAVVVLKVGTGDADAGSPVPAPFYGTTSDGSRMTVDLIASERLQINIATRSAACSPDGGVPAAKLSIPVEIRSGEFRARGRLPVRVSYQGRDYPRAIEYEIDGGVSGHYIAGHLNRIDTFDGRTCIRDVTFRAHKD